MRQSRLLAGTGLAALLVSLVALLPARVALGVLGLPAGVVAGVSGTAWSGTADRVSLGDVTLGPVRWSARPFLLLTGQAAAAVEATLPEGFLSGTIALRLGGKLVISDLEAAAPLSWLAPAAGAGGGQVAARFDRLALKAGQVVTAIGTLNVAGVVLPIATPGRQLGPGTYSVAFDTEALGPGEPLTGLLTDAGGPLEIAGTVTFTPPRSYELTGKAKARPEAPPELRNALQMLGPATPDGAHDLSIAGSF
ncbi:MAG: type II secretion system protein N [Chromatiales bacterium]|nr:type II secretion system protein N [Chromatiales bacterium]